MAIINRIADYFDEMQGWRHHMHAYPELGFDCFETAKFVKSKLEEFGVDEIYTEIAKTGIVAIIRGKSIGKTIGRLWCLSNYAFSFSYRFWFRIIK